jgi:glycosyltransferase involved in cell wall biosynthesis
MTAIRTAREATLSRRVAPRLSIITPSFQQAAFIEKTLRSVLDQGYENLEYLVVDGGSTDGSAEIIERYADRLAWWVSEPDDGQTHALNKGLERATGEVIAYINSDDYYRPGAFAAAMDALRGTDALWVAGDARFVFSDGSPDHVWHAELPATRHRFWWAAGPWGVPQAATFWRRECFDRHGLFRQDMHYVFDTEFGLRLAFAGHLPTLVDEELAVRVVHEEAKSWDTTPFEREARAMEREYRERLTHAERAHYLVSRVADRAGLYRTAGSARRALAR